MYKEKNASAYRTRHIIGLIAMGLIVSSTSFAEIQKWTDKDGKVHFGDRAPDGVNAEVITVRPITYENPDIGNLDDLFARDETASVNKVIMYSAEWCGVCRKARNYFQANAIPFEEYDVEKSARGQRDYRRMNARGVPVILVGNQRLNGFSPGSFQRIHGSR